MSKARDGVEDLKTIDANLAAKAPLASPSFTGTVSIDSPNQASGGSALKIRQGNATQFGIDMGLSQSTGHLNISRVNSNNATHMMTLARDTGNVGVGTASPAKPLDVTGDIRTSGNLVIGTSGKGIDFSIVADSSATGASTNSEILDCYEEGTWTPAIMLTTGNVTLSEAFNYTKVGRLVTLRGYIYNGSSIANTNAIWQFGGLPFQPLRETYGAVAQYATTVPGDSEYCNIYVNPTHSYLRIYSTRTGTNDWLQWSNIGGGHIDFHITYMATS